MCRIESLNRRIVKSCYDSTSTNFTLTRIVRFYQLTILPMIQIARLFFDRIIIDQNRDFNNHGCITVYFYNLKVVIRKK